MLYFGDIFAWISSNGITNESFAIERPASNCITCWIASESGKKFAVNWSNTSREFPLQGVVSIDGVVCDNHVMLDKMYPDKPSAIGVSFARTSDYTQRDFMFSTIEVTDDDAYLHTLEQSFNFGTITLELWRLRVANVVTKPMHHQYGSPVLEHQIVHERSKKAGTHHVRYGEEYTSPNPVVDMVTSCKIDQAPYVSFTFRYRPLAMLMANEVVPRPLDFFYDNTYANQIPRAATGNHDAASLAEIRRLESRLDGLRSRVRRAGRDPPTRKRIKIESDRADIIDLT